MILILFLLFFHQILCLHNGDRILTSIQTLHSSWKTPYLDLALNQLPSFRKASSALIDIPMPRPDENGDELVLNETEDLKVSFTFAHGKLMIPWITLYDSKSKSYVTSIKFMIIHDEFDILRVTYQLEFAETKLDENELKIPEIELYYEYDNVQEEDLALGIFTMFVLVLMTSALLLGTVLQTYDKRFLATEGSSRTSTAKSSASYSNNYHNNTSKSKKGF